MIDLQQQHCEPQVKGSPVLANQEIANLHTAVQAWQLLEINQAIEREFKFKNYYQTIAFVNAIAWMSHYENHHPDLEVGYNHCLVRYSTHAIHGLSENDFICAAKINELGGVVN